MSEKNTLNYVEDLNEPDKQEDLSSTESQISEEHKEFLLKHHGRSDLVPLPSMDLADPLNWPKWKKIANLLVVSFQSMVAIYTASCPIPGFELISEDLNTPIVKISYIASVPIIFAGLPILFWKPIANRYGRRPIWIWASIVAGLFNIGAARSNSYGVLMLMRILPPTFSCAAVALGGATVSDTFFKHHLATFLGVWNAFTTFGPPLGPFVTGFLIQHTGDWRSCFYFLAGLNFLGALLAVFFAPETLYIRDYANKGELSKSEVFKNEYVRSRRINKKPFTLREFYYPFLMWRYPTVIIPAIAHSVAFSFTIPAISISIPSSYGPKFGLGPQGVGLQFIAFMIGTILGEIVAGPFSDLLMNRKHQTRKPIFRLWGSHLGFVACVAGVLVWGITLQNAKVGKWIVTPDIGIAIGAFGNQVLTTILITFAISCFPNQADATASAIVQVRQIWSFLVPFFTPVMFANLEYTKSAGLMVGLIGITGIIPVTLLHIKGTRRPILDEVDNSH